MDMVATQNFRSVDRLLAAPSSQAAEQIRTLGGHDPARLLLRYQVSEQNRWYFETWEDTQMVLAIALFLVLIFGIQPERFPLLLMLLALGIVLLMHFVLTPEIIRLGRAIDFAPPGAPSSDRTRFWTFHGLYSACELVKLGLVLVLAYQLLRKRKKSQTAAVDRAPEPENSHAA